MAKKFPFTEPYCEVTVGGLPALARIISYDPGHNLGFSFAEIECYQLIDHSESEDVEYELYDRKGYRAGWLDTKAENQGLWDKITDQVLEACRKNNSMFP